MKTLSLTSFITWLGLRDERLFRRVESPVASSAHFIEFGKLDIVLGKEFGTLKAFKQGKCRLGGRPYAGH